MDIMNYVDLTELHTGCNVNDIYRLIDKAVAKHCASVCIPPCYVKQAKSYITDSDFDMKICTVIGFPNGYNRTCIKIEEAEVALRDGADEIDMVANIGWEMDERYDLLEEEIRKVKSVCNNYACDRQKPVILKVIVESASLSYEVIRQMCRVIHEAGGDYIKTSTGFSLDGGASDKDLAVMRSEIDKINREENITPNDGLQIKASGGIRTKEKAMEFIEMYGVSRIGASNIE